MRGSIRRWIYVYAKRRIRAEIPVDVKIVGGKSIGGIINSRRDRERFFQPQNQFPSGRLDQILNQLQTRRRIAGRNVSSNSSPAKRTFQLPESIFIPKKHRERAAMRLAGSRETPRRDTAASVFLVYRVRIKTIFIPNIPRDVPIFCHVRFSRAGFPREDASVLSTRGGSNHSMSVFIVTYLFHLLRYEISPYEAVLSDLSNNDSEMIEFRCFFLSYHESIFRLTDCWSTRRSIGADWNQPTISLDIQVWIRILKRHLQIERCVV